MDSHVKIEKNSMYGTIAAKSWKNSKLQLELIELIEKYYGEEDMDGVQIYADLCATVTWYVNKVAEDLSVAEV